jgi:hypothetical protein
MESRIFSPFVGLQKLVLAGESVIPVARPCFYHIFTRNTTLIKGVDYTNMDKGIHLKLKPESTLPHVKQGLKIISMIIKKHKKPADNNSNF